MEKWIVYVDHQGERANTVFEAEDEAYAFAELLHKQSSFDQVFVRRLVLPDPLLSQPEDSRASPE